MRAARRVVMVLVAACAAAFLQVAMPAAAADWVAPRFDRFLSGPSRPLVAAWGVAYNPVTDEVVVADYVSNQIRRFDRAGEYLGDLTNPAGNTESIISAVAVDPRDGAIYAAATSATSPVDVRKYDAAGNYLWGFQVDGRVAWLDVDDEGHVWFPPAYGGTTIQEFAVNDAARTVTRLKSFGTSGTGTCQNGFLNGIDVTSDGLVYAADGVNRVVHVYNATTGACLRDLGGPSIITGDLRGVAVDESRNQVYAVDAKGNDIEVFAPSGAHLATWNRGEGNGPGQFGAGARQLAVTPDGRVYAADYSGNRVNVFDPDGNYVTAFPSPQRDADPAGLIEPHGIDVDPGSGDIAVADHWGHRVERFQADGSLIRTFGRRGRLPEKGFNYPRDLSFDPATGNLWVLNVEGQPWLVVYDDDFNVLRQIRTIDLTTGVDVVGGMAYVYARSRVVQVIDTSTFTEVRRFTAASSGQGESVGVDPATGRIWTTVRTSSSIRVFNNNGTLAQTVTASSAASNVAFRDGVAYVTLPTAGVVEAFDAVTGQRLGSFGTSGTGAGQLRGPSGISVGADGRLYVVEERNQRISVFSFDAAPATETNRPALEITTPAGAAAGPALPLRVAGTATDDTGVSTVEVAMRDAATNLWWDVRAGTWKTAVTYNPAVLSGPLTSVSWAIAGVPFDYGDQVELRLRARDASGNTVSRTRTIGVADTVAPQVSIGSPADGSTQQPGTLPVTITASDDGGLATVEYALVDPDGGASPVWQPAQPAGSGWTAWTGAVQLPPAGARDVRVRAVDAAGNVATASVRVSPEPDATAPETEITAPAAGAVVTGPLTIAGTAADNIAVNGVEVSLRLGDDRWWNAATGTLSTGSAVWNPASASAPGSAATAWTLAAGTLPSGSWRLQARATDAAGLTDASPSTRTVTVPAGGNTAPETTVGTPAASAIVVEGSQTTGTATDTGGVAAVQVTVRDTVTLRYWNVASGAWQTALVRNPAALTAPGATSTGWSFALPAADGGDNRLSIGARAVDDAGVTDDTPATRSVVGRASAAGHVDWDVWTGRSGTSLSNIPTGTAPSSTSVLDLRSSGLTVDSNLDNFGGRVRVLLTPAVSGDYRFYLASDDAGSLRLNPNGTNPAQASQIASVSGFTGLNEWTKYSSQASALVSLVAGQQYYLEAVVKEGSSSDHVQVGWISPGSSTVAVVPAAVIAPAVSLGTGGWR